VTPVQKTKTASCILAGLYRCSESCRKVVGKYTSQLATDRCGNTPLHVAVAEGKLECVKQVLELDFPSASGLKSTWGFCVNYR
jgi:hypothetical protein